MTTPANWKPGEDVIVHPSVSTEDARKVHGNVVEHKVSVLRCEYLAVHADQFMTGSTTSGRRRSLHKRVYERSKICGILCRCSVQLSFHGNSSLCSSEAINKEDLRFCHRFKSYYVIMRSCTCFHLSYASSFFGQCSLPHQISIQIMATADGGAYR